MKPASSSLDAAATSPAQESRPYTSLPVTVSGIVLQAREEAQLAALQEQRAAQAAALQAGHSVQQQALQQQHALEANGALMQARRSLELADPK